MDIDTLSDPARFAQAIRDLARDAHETLTALALRGGPAGALPPHRGARVRPRRSRGPARDLAGNLGQEVRSATVRRDETSRTMCLCA